MLEMQFGADHILWLVNSDGYPSQKALHMPNAHDSKTPLWREFERLIARVEEALVPHGAIVKSPDRIRSLLTGRFREVDASIRAKVGSTEILVTIECRRRSARQDVTWLEQLHTKKQVIGAARTIAVSASPFSDDAIRVAAHYGIDLRMANQIDPQELGRWIFPVSFIHLFKEFELHEAPIIEVDTSLASEFDQELVASVSPDSAVFTIGDTGPYVSLNDVWLQAQQVIDFYQGVPVDGTKVLRRINLSISNDLRMKTEHSLLPVILITMSGAFFWRREEIPLSEATIIRYEHTGEKLHPSIARAEFETSKAPTNNLRFGYQVEEGGANAVLSVQLLQSKKQ